MNFLQFFGSIQGNDVCGANPSDPGSASATGVRSRQNGLVREDVAVG